MHWPRWKRPSSITRTPWSIWASILPKPSKRPTICEKTLKPLFAGDRKLDEMLLAQRAYRDRLAHVVEFASDYYRMLNQLNLAVGLNTNDLKRGATNAVGEMLEKK